jgi:trans-aconitate methyltransferase
MEKINLISPTEKWDNIQGYEMYVGRWSKLLSIDFVDWLNARQNSKWLEIGCGTAALTKVIADKCMPSNLLAVDKSDSYLEKARETTNPGNIFFLNADINSYILNGKFQYITSGLFLNFVPEIDELLRRLVNNLKIGGQMSAFVWDYGGHYQPMRHFWNAAREMIPGSEKFDAGQNFEICSKEKLIQLFEKIGLNDIQFTTIEKVATFQDFNDYWLPISNAQGSVTKFMSTLTDTEKDELKEHIRGRLPIAFNGEIKLVISAIAVKGRR